MTQLYTKLLNTCLQIVQDSASEQLKPYYYLRYELSVENLSLLWGNRVLIH